MVFFLIAHEKRKLTKAGLHNLANKVTSVLDGKGYDVFSYDLNENEIYIEVKTTKQGIKTPFYMSINEKEYLEKFPENYLLYRVYDYDEARENGRFYIKTGMELKKAIFKPIQFEVSF
ncbi:MAG: DUF3883 domain-containing protein [Saprospiraceae bacterium]